MRSCRSIALVLTGLALFASAPARPIRAEDSVPIRADDSAAAKRAPSKWTYLGDSTLAYPFSPLFRRVALANVRPDRCVESTVYPGRSRRYAQIRYGTEDSDRVILVLDEVDSREADLYVDLNRNRAIETKEKVARHPSAEPREAGAPVCEWIVPLSAQIVSRDTSKLVPRTVLVRWRGSSNTLSIATLGYCEGFVELGGRRVKARRIDGDANGLFSDLADRLWVDANADGAWDDLAEQFPLTPSIQIAGRRYAVRGDRLGNQLRLEPMLGEGRVRLQPARLARETRIREMTCLLVGEDGNGFTLAGLEPSAVPVGRYSIGALWLTVEDDRGRSWSYQFTRDPGGVAERGFLVEKGRELTVDPVGRLRLNFENEYKSAGAHAGQTLCYRPLLFTEHGLNTNFCRFADDTLNHADDPTTAHFRLETIAGLVVDRTESHYACGALCDFALTIPARLRERELKLDADVDLGPVGGKVTAASLIRIGSTLP
jgi:hypothetical protein